MRGVALEPEVPTTATSRSNSDNHQASAPTSSGAGSANQAAQPSAAAPQQTAPALPLHPERKAAVEAGVVDPMATLDDAALDDSLAGLRCVCGRVWILCGGCFGSGVATVVLAMVVGKQLLAVQSACGALTHWCVFSQEERIIAKTKRQAARDADSLTPEMKEDVITLLRLFGVPYILRFAPPPPILVWCGSLFLNVRPCPLLLCDALADKPYGG